MASYPSQSKESLGSSPALQGQHGDTRAKDFFVEKRESEMEKHSWEKAMCRGHQVNPNLMAGKRGTPGKVF